MTTVIITGLIGFMLLVLFSLLVVLFAVSMRKKKPATPDAPMVSWQPNVVLSAREQAVQDKLAAVVNAYRKAEQEKFETDAVAEAKLLLK